MTPPRPFVAVALAVALTACTGREAVPAAPAPAAGETAPTAESPPAGGPVAYDFERPDATFRLAPDLEEISALSWTGDGHLVAVQDEDGIVFTLDPADGSIVQQRRFRGGGDYEGVEWVDGTTWVLRSNGRLNAVPDAGGDAEEFETPLRGRCDAEGLAYDAARGRLLIACKEDPGRGLGDVKAVYAFSLATRTLDAQPALVMQRSALDGDGANFKPSALAVHPQTGELYVLSSVRKAVAVVAMDGRVVTVTPLPAALYPQPEGLAFAPDGTLYLSSEAGDTDTGLLLRFRPRR